MSDRQGSSPIFGGSIPELYERYLVPLIFEQYAHDLVARLRSLDVVSILEVAAGSGVVTRAMAAGLPASVSITATELSQAMIDQGELVGTSRPVTWQRADVLALPFGDASFDAVVCQFGVMFLPDRPAAFAEVARVLRPGGVFMFNVWDAIEQNEFAAVVAEAVGRLFADDPPGFLERTPYAYFDTDLIQADVAAGGFESPASVDALEARSRASSPEVPAIAFCQGSPLRDEIEARDPSRLAEATALAAAAIEQRFGSSDLDAKIRGYVITATKPTEDRR